MKILLPVLIGLLGVTSALAQGPVRLMSPSGDYIEFTCPEGQRGCHVDYHRLQGSCHKGFEYEAVWNTGLENKMVPMRCYRMPKEDGSIYFFRVAEPDLVRFVRDYPVFSVVMADNSNEPKASVFETGPVRNKRGAK